MALDDAFNVEKIDGSNLLELDEDGNMEIAGDFTAAGGFGGDMRFGSTEQTGTGALQNVAHGLGATPGLVWIAVTEDPAGVGFDVAEGAHDATNIVVTVTSGVKFRAYALL